MISYAQSMIAHYVAYTCIWYHNQYHTSIWYFLKSLREVCEMSDVREFCSTGTAHISLCSMMQHMISYIISCMISLPARPMLVFDAANWADDLAIVARPGQLQAFNLSLNRTYIAQDSFCPLHPLDTSILDCGYLSAQWQHCTWL